MSNGDDRSKETLIMSITIAQLILQYGPSIVTSISQAFEKGNPTPDEIKALFITKKPEEYFEEEA